MSERPKFIATRDVGDEFLTEYGAGDTPEAALQAFAAPDGHLAEYARRAGIPSGAEVRVEVWTTCDPRDSDWPAEDVEANDWLWVCDSLHRVVNATVPLDTTRT